MLFLYERLWQIPDAELAKLVKANKEIGKSYRPESLLWANELDDDTLLAWLNKLYPSIDNNYLKRARSIHHQRKAAAHVSDMVHDIHSVDAFLKELLSIIEKIQSCHEHYLKMVDTARLPDLLQEMRLSLQDTEFLLITLINEFEKSPSFDASTEISERLMQMKSMLTNEHVEMILAAIQKNSKGSYYHQILHANGASFFLRRLYQVRSEPSEAWRTLASYIVDDAQKKGAEEILPRFNWLFEIFDMEQFSRKPSPSPEAAEDEQVDLSDIPF